VSSFGRVICSRTPALTSLRRSTSSTVRVPVRASYAADKEATQKDEPSTKVTCLRPNIRLCLLLCLLKFQL
jgi:hypothetical protein